MVNKHSKQRSAVFCVSNHQPNKQSSNQLSLNKYRVAYKQTAPHQPSLTAAAPHNGHNRPAAAVLRFLCPAWATPGV